MVCQAQLLEQYTRYSYFVLQPYLAHIVINLVAICIAQHTRTLQIAESLKLWESKSILVKITFGLYLHKTAVCSDKVYLIP